MYVFLQPVAFEGGLLECNVKSLDKRELPWEKIVRSRTGFTWVFEVIENERIE
jgi:hypothetical protein